MIPSKIYIVLHRIFIILVLLSIFIIDYTKCFYLIIIFICVYVQWVVHGCILQDYEAFIQCNYENKEDMCHLSNRYPFFNRFDISINSYSFILWSGLLILLYRYFNKINFISIPHGDLVFPLSLFIVFINLLLIILPAYYHYKQYKHYKLLLIYIITLILCTTLFIYYLKYIL